MTDPAVGAHDLEGDEFVNNGPPDEPDANEYEEVPYDLASGIETDAEVEAEAEVAPRAQPDPAARPLSGRGRFLPDEEATNTLLDGVAEVALAAERGDRDRALQIPKSRWDRQRVALERWDLPTGQTVRRRLRCSWGRAVKVALAPVEHRARVLNGLQGPQSGRQSHERGGPTQTLELDPVDALKAVSWRAGGTPTQGQYDELVELMHLERSRKREVVALRLPGSTSVIARFGGWSDALAAAGLETRVSPSHARGESPVDVLDRYITEFGVVPTKRYFQSWCGSRGVVLRADLQAQMTWPAALELVRARRTERGDTTPADSTPAKQCPALPDLADRRVKYQKEDALASLRLYAQRHALNGRQPRSLHYLEAARTDKELMCRSTLLSFGLWQVLCREAGIS